MSWKPSVWLLILVVLTSLFIFMIEQKTESSARALPLDVPLLQFSPDTVSRLAVKTRDVAIECVRRDGQWFLIRPIEARADEARIKHFIQALDDCRVRETLTAERLIQRNLTFASFGLESPRAQLLVGNESRVDEVLVGDESPLGDLVYLRLKNSPDVVGASCKFGEILPFDLDSVKDRAVFPASLKRVVRLELKHAAGFVQLALRDGQWRIQQPVDARADNRQVELLIQSLMALKIGDFGSGKTPSDFSVYGLATDDAVLQITLTPEGRAPLVLTVGKARQDQPSLVYAKISDVPSICSIDKAILALQAVKVDSLRDRRLCHADPAAIVTIMAREGDSKLVMVKDESGRWQIAEPFRFKADAQAVGGLLRAICNVKVVESAGDGQTNGLNGVIPPFPCRLSIAMELPAESVTNQLQPPGPDGTAWTYRFAAPGADGTNSPVYCDETKTLTEVSPQELRAVWPQFRHALSLADPRPYMDCRMFELQPDQVRRITSTRKGREETVTVGNDGIWLADSPPDGQIVKGSIPALLNMAASLQAERIESMNATNTSTYGISESSARITFGLTGTNGIQKTVILGNPCGTNGIYSMIQGQDVVFVLKNELAQALTRPLVESR